MGSRESKIMLRKVFEKEVCSEMKIFMIITNKNNPKRVVNYFLFKEFLNAPLSVGCWYG
jgi:hypothetical protein